MIRIWGTLIGAALVAACGRIDFDVTSAPGDTGGAGRRVSFGETGMETYSGVTRDTSLQGTAGMTTLNLGTHITVKMDISSAIQAGLLAFDLSAVSGQSQATAAELHLHVEQDPLGGGHVQSIHRVREAWDEGTVDNLPGAANWMERTPGVSWSTPGAAVPLSSDTEEVANITPDTADTTYVVPFNATGLAMINEWISNPASNFGVVFPPPSISGWAFTSSNASVDASWRPVLVLWLDP